MKTLSLFGLFVTLTGIPLSRVHADDYIRDIPLKFETIQKNEKKYDWFGNLVSVNTRSVDVWTPAQKARLSRAVKILGERMLQPAVKQCAIDNHKTFYHLSCTPKIDGSATYLEMTKLQLGAFLHIGFPQLLIRKLFNPEKGVAGLGDIGIVSVFVKNNAYAMRGSFVVQLAESAFGGTDDYLAGAIAHEMLHNLCHTHKSAEENGYSDGNFMTVFGDCVANNGVYKQHGTLMLTDGSRLFLDKGSRNPSGGKVGGIVSEDGTAVVQVDRMERLRANNFIDVNLKVDSTVKFVTGSWSADRNIAKVHPMVGHKNDAHLEKYRDLKILRTEPFGRVLVRIGNTWYPVGRQMTLPPGDVRFQMNDTALGDNAGEILIGIDRFNKK